MAMRIRIFGWPRLIGLANEPELTGFVSLRRLASHCHIARWEAWGLTLGEVCSRFAIPGLGRRVIAHCTNKLLRKMAIGS
jgi:hypothetical protein